MLRGRVYAIVGESLERDCEETIEQTIDSLSIRSDTIRSSRAEKRRSRNENGRDEEVRREREREDGREERIDVTEMMRRERVSE